MEDEQVPVKRFSDEEIDQIVESMSTNVGASVKYINESRQKLLQVSCCS